MLVLSRKAGERIKIGDDITVVVTRVAGNRVMLGVEAPRNMRIVRSELKPLSEAEVAMAHTETAVPETPAIKMPASRPLAIPVRQPQLAAMTTPTGVAIHPPLTVELTSNSTAYLARRAR